MLLSLVSVLHYLVTVVLNMKKKKKRAKYLVTSPVQQDTLVERKYV